MLQFLEACLTLLALTSGATASSSSRGSGSGGDTSYGNGGEINPKLLLSPIWKLQDLMLSGYIPTVRPVLDPSAPVDVGINFILFNLLDLVRKATFEFVYFIP